MKYELPSTELIVIEENNYLKFGEYLNDMQCDDTANKLSLDDLEYVKKLQQENLQLQSELECTIGIVEHNRIISEKNKEIHQLKDNWNKLKEHLKEKIAEGRSPEHLWLMGCYDEDKLILEKIQELEQGDDK